MLQSELEAVQDSYESPCGNQVAPKDFLNSSIDLL